MIPRELAQFVAPNVLLYHVVNGLLNGCLVFYWHLPLHMLYWWHCWIHFDIILFLKRAKSVKLIEVKPQKVLNTSDCL